MGISYSADRVFCHHLHPNCSTVLGIDLYSLLKKLNPQSKRNILYLCIGSDRATGDCFGPLVGERLKDFIPASNIWGCLEKPVHALNLNDAINEIYNCHINPLVIVIDACLGSYRRVGCLKVEQGSISPGLALNKDLPGIGDINMIGIVNVSGYQEQQTLQSTRLFTVSRMAETAVRAIRTAHELLATKKGSKCFT